MRNLLDMLSDVLLSHSKIWFKCDESGEDWTFLLCSSSSGIWNMS